MSAELGMTEAAVGAVTALVGVIWKQHNGRITKIEASLMTKEMCVAHGLLLEQKIITLQEKVSDLKGTNKDDHEDLARSLDTITHILADMRDCVTKLSVGVDCE